MKILHCLMIIYFYKNIIPQRGHGGYGGIPPIWSVVKWGINRAWECRFFLSPKYRNNYFSKKNIKNISLNSKRTNNYFSKKDIKNHFYMGVSYMDLKREQERTRENKREIIIFYICYFLSYSLLFSPFLSCLNYTKLLQ
jgi:hypothetical protein